MPYRQKEKRGVRVIFLWMLSAFLCGCAGELVKNVALLPVFVTDVMIGTDMTGTIDDGIDKVIDPDGFAWNTAKKANTPESYSIFIEQFPNSEYIKKAHKSRKKRIAERLHKFNIELLRAVILEESSEVKGLVTQGANLDVGDGNGNSLSLFFTDLFGVKNLKAKAQSEEWNGSLLKTLGPLLHLSVALGNMSLSELLLELGANPNATDSFGNTPLHLAHYVGDAVLIRLFMEHGSDINVRNRYGLTAADFSDAPKVFADVTWASELLDERGLWRDEKKGSQIYKSLKSSDPRKVINGIVGVVLSQPQLRLGALILAVKLGIDGTEDKLNYVLLNHGSESMAEDFLNSGSRELASGGRKWATANNYSINTGPGSHRASWGKF